MLKKTTLAVLGLAASGFAFAGAMGPVCTPGNVTVPCVAKAWDLGIEALYLKSVYDADKVYAQNVLNHFNELQNDWDWGYRLEGSYHFNTGNDITIDWTHYQGEEDYSLLNGAVFPLRRVNIPYTQSISDRFDQVNLVMGQHADFGLVKKMRFYGGLQYANIQAYSNNTYSVSIPQLNIIGVGLFDNTDYKGIGPVAGIDYSYNITNELSITANGAGSILYGTSRYNTGYVALNSNGIIASIYASKKAIVPSLEAKLGLNYAYNMGQGIVNLAGGYQVVNYFNALQTQVLQNFVGPVTNSDYGLYGPYVGVTYVGMA